LRERTIRYLKGVFSKILKLDANRLETEAPFDKLGIDSLVVAEILAALEKDFGSLPSILLMDRITIGQLSDYFLAEKKASLERVLQLTSGSPKHLEDPAQPSATVPKQGTPDREAASRSISIQPPPDLSDAEVNAQLEQLLEGPTP
jgi:acyl carrier protein